MLFSRNLFTQLMPFTLLLPTNLVRSSIVLANDRVLVRTTNRLVAFIKKK
jgi:hypothetical protein